MLFLKDLIFHKSILLSLLLSWMLLVIPAIQSTFGQATSNSNTPLSSSLTSHTLTRIIDGDTVVVSGTTQIRLSLINTPERGQIGYREAITYLESICPVNRQVLIDIDDKQPRDQYGRTVALLYCFDNNGNTLNANELLLTSRHAVIETRFCSRSEFSTTSWASPYCNNPSIPSSPSLPNTPSTNPIFPPPLTSPLPSSPLSHCEIFTFTVEGTTNLANARENIDDANTDLTLEVNSILNPYDAHIRNDDLVSGKLWIDKDNNNEKELDFNVKEISNDCKVIAYQDDEHNEDDN